MNEEKILEAARKNGRGKEYENTKKAKHSMIGFFVAAVFGIAFISLKYFVKGDIDIGILAILVIAGGVQWICDGIRFRNIFSLVLGIVVSLVAAFLILAFVGQVIQK